MSQAAINQAREAATKAKAKLDAKLAEIDGRDDKNPTVDEKSFLVEATTEMTEAISTAKTLEAAANSSDEAKAAFDRWALPADEAKEAAREHAGKGHSTVSVGELFTGAKSYREFVKMNSTGERISDSVHVGHFQVAEAKTLLTGLSSTSGGAMVINDHQPGVTDLVPFREFMIRSIFRQLTTASDTVEYTRITTKTNAAAPVLEATATSGTSGAAAESALAFEVVTTNVESVSHWIPATKRAFADAGQLKGIIDAFLIDGLEDKVETQLLNGDGTSPNLRGVINQSGVQTKIISTTLDLDETLAMIALVRTVGRRSANFLAVHPDLFWTSDLAYKKDGQGHYLLLDPTRSVDVINLWGLQTKVTDAVPSASPIVGDGRWGAVWDREQSSLSASDSHDNFFIRKMVAILGDTRLAFGLFDPQAFVVGTAT